MFVFVSLPESEWIGWIRWPEFFSTKFPWEKLENVLEFYVQIWLATLWENNQPECIIQLFMNNYWIIISTIDYSEILSYDKSCTQAGQAAMVS